MPARSEIPDPRSEIAPRTIFNAFLRCKGDLEAVALELNVDAWSIAEWAMRPEIDERLSALSKLHRFTIRRQLANALPETIDKLREHVRSGDPIISCKACCALARLAQSPEGRTRPATQAPGSSTTHQHAPGRIKPVPNPLDEDRFSTHSLRSGLVSPHAAFESPRITHAAVTPQGNPTSPERSGASPRSDGTAATNPSPPLDASCPDASIPSSPTPCLRGSVPSCLPLAPGDSPPTFGLTQAQLDHYSSNERKHLISVPLPEGGYTTFDSSRPFAGFSGDAIDFMRADAHITCALPLDENTLYLLTRFIRPTPECSVPDFPIPDLDDSDPFPTLDPEWFPAPVPGIALPDNLKDLADLRLTPDISLTIARNKNPWLCLPLTGRGKPDRKRISTDTTARYAFRKVARALFDARNLARSAWNERWQRTELWRLITLHHEGRLPPLAPGPTPAREDPSADPPSDST